MGVAVTDPERRVARPLGVLRSVGPKRDAQALRELLAAEPATLLVVGLPLAADEDDEEGPSARACRARGEDLARRLRLPVEFVDETLTTVEAHEALVAAGVTRRRRREQVDAMAAVLILESWLRETERRRGGAP